MRRILFEGWGTLCDAHDTLHHLPKPEFMNRLPVTEPINQKGILHLQKAGEDLAFVGIEVFVVDLEITSQNTIEFTCATPTPIEESSFLS